MICYVLAMGKQHLGPHMVVGYGIKTFWPGLFITSPDHLDIQYFRNSSFGRNDYYSWNVNMALKKTEGTGLCKEV